MSAPRRQAVETDLVVGARVFIGNGRVEHEV